MSPIELQLHYSQLLLRNAMERAITVNLIFASFQILIGMNILSDAISKPISTWSLVSLCCIGLSVLVMVSLAIKQWYDLHYTKKYDLSAD